MVEEYRSPSIVACIWLTTPTLPGAGRRQVSSNFSMVEELGIELFLTDCAGYLKALTVKGETDLAVHFEIVRKNAASEYTCGNTPMGRPLSF